MRHRSTWVWMAWVGAVSGCYSFGVEPDSSRPSHLTDKEKTVTTYSPVPIFMVAGAAKEGGGTKEWVGPVIKEKNEVADLERSWFPWPIFQTERRATNKSVAVPPVYWCHEDGGQGQEFIFPIFFRWRDGMQRTTFIAPLYKQVDHLEQDVGGRVRVSKTETWLWPLFNLTTEHKLEAVEEPED